MAALADLEQLVAQWAPVLRDAFLSAVYAIRERVVLADVVRAVARGDVEGALAAVGLDPAAFRPVELALAQAFEGGGNATTESFPALRGPSGARLLVLFDIRNHSAESWLRTHSSELIRELVDGQKEAVREHLTAAMEAGENPRTAALDLVGRINPQTRKREGGVIGLTASQEKWVKQYELELATADPAALSRKLRDKRFDKMTAKAAAAGVPLSPEQRAKMVAAYRARTLRYRAENIARTEAMAALNQSQMEGVDQGIAKGAIQERYVTKTWHSAGDRRVRESHREMNKQRVPYRATFVAPSGARLRYPGDPDAPAEERCMCRCWMEVRVNFVAQAVGQAA